ncbi:MAG TPA: hypothetical protein VN853_15535 [Polyangia bacterium]|nr:hypothetical protein [Polyangia bacterium]
MKKIGVVAILSLLSVLFSAGAAEAFTNETCTVGSVSYAPAYISPTGAGSDMLIIGCSNDSTYYFLAVGTPAANSCYASVDTVKALEAVALAARTSGRSLTIPYATATCPGIGSVRVLSELIL